MEKISCNIARDLLPLYIDSAVSPETADAVKQHLNQCPNCQREHLSMIQNLTLPVSRNLSCENARALLAFKRRWKRKKVMTALVSAFISLLLFALCSAIYQNVGAVHDFFSPSIHATLRNLNSDKWQKVTFNSADVLTLDSIFYSGEVVNDGNSSGSVCLRITDEKGNAVIPELELSPGTSAVLDALKKYTPYTVEIKSDADFVRLGFY